MRSRTLLLLAGLLSLSATAARAQDDDDWYYDRHPTGGYAGLSFTYADPQGEFSDFVKQGWGLDLHYLHRLDRDGWLGIRAEGGFLIYGHERQRVPLSPTLGGRIQVDLVTDNNIAFLGVGPQIGVPDGRLRPYVNGYVGVSYIYTESSVEGTYDYDNEPFARTNNFDDASFAYGGGAGLYIPLRHGASPISIDAGVTYRRNGTADYLTEGGIQDNPDGSVTLYPVRSETDLLTFHLGVSIGIAH
ncbi:MAG TPA: hypothetical protein VFQ39_05300 [Longimicrobium sp.]|nr:hypothetical protein [Longimicrobium sp.]